MAMAIGDGGLRWSRLKPAWGEGQEVDIGRRKGEPRAAGTGRCKGEKVKICKILDL